MAKNHRPDILLFFGVILALRVADSVSNQIPPLPFKGFGFL
jgi:hypothetical protein